jgi:DNA-binding transcriptional LysR family regulator
MNLLHLQYFYVVAKEGGFMKASKALRIQQPAISRMVKLLEDDLGLSLFEKIGRNVRLTAQGQEVFDSCKKIFGEVDHLKVSLGQIKGECQGPLTMAASDPIASNYLPKLLSGYLAKHPKVHPQIFSGPASSLLENIIKGEVELGMFFHIPDLSEKLEIFKKQDVRYRLVVRKDLKRNKKTLESFIGSREIDDTSTRRFPTLDRLRQEYKDARIVISCNNLTSHRQMVLQGLGVAILPEFLVAEDLKAGVLTDVLAKEEFVFQMKFIKRKNGVLSLNAKSLLEEIAAQ